MGEKYECMEKEQIHIKQKDYLAPMVLLIVGLPVCTLYLKWSYREQKYKVQENAGFVFDNPIKYTGNDSIGRAKFAANLADRIKNTSNEESAFAIGVASEWGNGKTSFFNLIEKHLLSVLIPG